MGVINRNNTLQFKSGEYVISDVKRFLKSFDSVNAIDDGEFPTYIRDALRQFGIGAMKEQEAVIKVENQIVDLPEDFEKLYDLYRCKDNTQRKVKSAHEQNTAIIYNDITRDVLYNDKNCVISCFQNNSQILERITIKQMVDDSFCIWNFSYPTPLFIGNKSTSPFSVSNFGIANGCENEVALDGKKLYLNFCDDWLYIRYYGLPMDEYGIPMIPDANELYQAVKWYIIYQVSLSWWWNNDVPDIQNKWQQAESQYKFWSAEASYYVKLPSFAGMIDSAKDNQRTSLYNFFSKNMYRNR